MIIIRGVGSSPHLSVPLLFLVLAGLCLLTNATILLKLLLKPKLWSLVNLGLSVLLGRCQMSFIQTN